jgi:hypothetical protein
LKEGIAAGLMVIYSRYFEPFMLETPLYVAGETDLTCNYHDVPPRDERYMGDSMSVRLADDNVISCTYYHDKNIHQISFTRTTAGDTTIIGTMRVNIRDGVCIHSCAVRFWGKSNDDRCEYIIESSGICELVFSVAGCWTVLRRIASCLDAGGHIVTHPTKLGCVDRDNKPVMCIGVDVDSEHDDMPGIVSGYAEAWITTANTTTQSHGIVLVEPNGYSETSNEYDAVIRRYVHRKIAVARTALIN